MSSPNKQPAFSWSSHALLTRAALKSFHCARVNERIMVTNLEDFLKRAKSELSSLILWYWDLLNEKSGSTSRIERPPGNLETEADFRTAMQINPKTRLHYVRLQAPEEVDLNSPHDPPREGPPGGLYLETPVGTELSAYEILFTYSDEPDWGMDQDLFELENHRYGAPPFGITHGISSQGPFHMAFLNENPLLIRVLPPLARTFLPERARVSFALSDLAFAVGENYWGWRFTAWAVHYLQDLTAPYHARAFPPALIPTLRSLLHGSDGRRWSKKLGDILKMHHVFFEAVVHLLLNEAVKKRLDHPFLSALASGGELPETIRRACGEHERSFHDELGDVIAASPRTASNLATKIDATLMALFSGRGIDDGRYQTGTEILESNSDILKYVVENRSDLFVRFLDLTSTCLTVTGRVTRYVVHRMCHASNDSGDGSYRKLKVQNH